MVKCVDVCAKYGRNSGKCLNPDSMFYGHESISMCPKCVSFSTALRERQAVTRAAVQNLVYRMGQDRHFTLESSEAADVFQMLVDIHEAVCK